MIYGEDIDIKNKENGEDAEELSSTENKPEVGKSTALTPYTLDVPEKSKSSEAQKLANFNDWQRKKHLEVADTETPNESDLFTAIKKIGMMQRKSKISFQELCDTFRDKIKGRSFFAYDDWKDRKNTILDTITKKPIFGWVPNEIWNGYYYTILRNINGRLGQVFELLFGQVSDTDSEADFGSDELGWTEAKTKNIGASSPIIGIAGNSLTTIKELCEETKIEENAPIFIDELVSEAINEILSKNKEYELLKVKVSKKNMAFTIPTSDISKISVTRDYGISKDLFTNSNTTHNLRLANSTEYGDEVDGSGEFRKLITELQFVLRRKNDETDFLTLYYAMSLSATLEVEDNKNISVLLTVILTPSMSGRTYNPYNLNAVSKTIKIPLIAVLNKIKHKCPKLIVAEGQDGTQNDGVSSRILTWYGFTSARTYEVNKNADAYTLIDVMKEGGIKIGFKITGYGGTDGHMGVHVESSFNNSYMHNLHTRMKNIDIMNKNGGQKLSQSYGVFIPCEPFVI